MNLFSRRSIVLVAIASFLAVCSAFELERCEVCLEEDVCEYCIKIAEDGSQVGVCDCNDDEVELYGDCEDSHWNAKVTKASACELLAYPKTAPTLMFLFVIISVIIVATGCFVVSQFMYRNLCCCFRVVKEEGRREMVNLNAIKNHEVI